MAAIDLFDARRWLIGIIVLCGGVEAYLSLSDLGLLEPAQMRNLAYAYGGFWPGLLGTWQPNYPTQPYLMFLSYSFLHGGIIHLVVNMVTLWSLGGAVIDRVKGTGFAILYGLSILGGAIGYMVLGEGLTPMVGASGALFGLAGGLLAWSYVDRFTAMQGLLPIVQAILLLALLNVILWWAMDGQLAWQTHLGGFISGWIVALLIDPRPAEI